MKTTVRGLLFWPVLIGLLLSSGCSKQQSLLMSPKLRVPGVTQKLLYKFDIRQGKFRFLDLGGSVLDVDLVDPRINDAIIILRFYDGDGAVCGFGNLRTTMFFKERFGFMYLTGGGGAKSFSRRVLVPVAATSVEIGISRFPRDNKRKIELHDFKCTVSGSAFVDFILDSRTWCGFGLLLMFGVVIFAICVRRRIVQALCLIPDVIKGFLMRADLSWICLLFVMVFFFFVGVRMAQVGCDMSAHINVAKSLRNPSMFSGAFLYPLWHLLVNLIKTLFNLEDIRFAAGLANGFCYNACLIGIYMYLRRTFRDVAPCGLIGMAFAVCTVGCMLGPWIDIKYLHENSHTAWHNPTNTMVKALALPCVLLTVRLLNKSLGLDAVRRIQWSQVIALGLVLSLAVLAKPSFIQVYLPAMFMLLVGWAFVKKGGVAFCSVQVFLALLLPCLILAVQYILIFDPSGDAGIGFGFMKVIGCYKYSGIHQFYVVAFPVAALIVSILRRKCHTEDILCWLMLLVGMVMRLFLFEHGPRMRAGNLSWGFGVALYLVWVVGIRQYVDVAVEQNKIRYRLGFWLLSVMLFLHVIMGFYKMYDMMCFGRKY